MSETVVHVTTLEQWKSVLDVWFNQGYSWYSGDKEYRGGYFKDGIRELLLDEDNDILTPIPGKREPISYQEFMAQQKEGNKMKTYYVTQEQFDLITFLKHKKAPLDWLIMDYDNIYRALRVDITNEKSNAILRHLGGDETIELKVKEQLYRLWGINTRGKKVYMRFLNGTPDWTSTAYDAFTASLEDIKKWKTPAWEIEEVY